MAKTLYPKNEGWITATLTMKTSNLAVVNVEQGHCLVGKAMEEFEFNDAYVAIILKGKFKGKYLASLDAKELVDLLSALNSRGRSKQERELNASGTADSWKRDKKQRDGIGPIKGEEPEDANRGMPQSFASDKCPF